MASGTTAAAEAALRAGDPAAALDALQAAVRAEAGNPRLRVFLFQLLAVQGQWERAVRQLKVAAEMDGAAEAMARTYREAIICELLREQVFAGTRQPLVFGQPAEWVALLIEALGLDAAGRHGAAADLRARAFDAAPATSGQLDGVPFEWIADADMRLGPVLEAVVNGRYFWVPFAAVAALRFEAPADLRDAVWMPATLSLPTGSEVVALVPTRYAGTAAAGTDAERLARATSWHPVGGAEGAGAGGGDDEGAVWAGRGQRVLATDSAETALMEVRELVLDTAAAAAAEAAAAAGAEEAAGEDDG
ncbi:MAG: tetratricopeptide repeat protein [Rhodobacteraceae bacterium]|nr:tetratricopeptide repeat protein [Paracoccaceae bacterium]